MMQCKSGFKIIFLLIFLFGLGGINFLSVPLSYAQNSEKELFFVAQKAFEDGFYDVAIRYLNDLLKNYPRSDKKVEANLLLGQCYFLKNQYLVAYDIFQKLLEETEHKDVTLFWLGETYLKGADYTQAEKQYQELIEHFPTSLYTPQAYYSLGWVYFEQDHFDQAKKTFEELLQKFPSHELAEDVAFKLGETEYHLKQYEKTIELFKQFVANYPQSEKHAEAYFYIAESYYYLADTLTASTYYAKAAEIAYDSKLILMAKVSLGWSYLKLKKFDLAQKSFEEAKQYAEEKSILSDDVFLGQASLFAETQNHEGALSAYNELIEHFPHTQRLAEAYLGKANILYSLKRYPEAIATYQLIIDQFSQDPAKQDLVEKAYFGSAWSYLKNGDIDSCIKQFKFVQDKTENKTVKISALTQIGDAYQDVGQLEKSIEIYDQILKEFPDSPYTDYVQYRQGVALLKMNRTESATLSFQSLQANFPDSKYLKDIKYYLAVAYFKKEEWGAAKDQISVFIANLPADNLFLSEAYNILALSQMNLGDQDIPKNYQK